MSENKTSEKSLHVEDGKDGLHRDLDSRHLSMIALGGTIGTGLFIVSGSTVHQGGPLGVLIAHCIVGVLVYAVVSGVGEMSTQVPISGAFGELSARYIHPAVGFTLGWNYYIQWLLTVPAEISAFGNIPRYWAKDTPSWYFTVGGLVMMFFLNIIGVKAFAEIEYWLSFIKIFAVFAFIVIGIAIVCGANSEVGTIGFRNWDPSVVEGAPLSSFLGLCTTLINAFYAYGGVEMVGVTAGEAKNPSVTVPKAIRMTFCLIFGFYLASLFVIGLIIPWTEESLQSEDIVNSPFTKALELAGVPYAADIMNAIILIAVFSAANGSIYCSTRTLQGLAANGMAPQFLVRTTKNGVPFNAIAISMLFGGIALIGAYVGDGTVFQILVSMLSISSLLSWVIIIITHLRFRWGWRAQGNSDSELVCRSPFFPYFDYAALFISLVIFAAILRATILEPEKELSIYAVVPMFALAYVGYIIYYKLGSSYNFTNTPDNESDPAFQYKAGFKWIEWKDMDFVSSYEINSPEVGEKDTSDVKKFVFDQ